MCLHINRIPEKGSNLVVKCFKELRPIRTKKGKRTGRWSSPIQRAEVSKDGCIVAHTKIRYTEAWASAPCRKTDQNATVEAGVHALQDEVGPRETRFHNCNRLRAYAFGVRAYGIHCDLVAPVVYVPHCDRTKHRAARERMCKKWASGEVEATWPQIRQFFDFELPR